MAGLMKPVTHLLLPFMLYWLPDVAVRRRKFLFCFKVQHPRNSHPVPSFSLPFEFPGGSFAITWLFRGRLLHYCRILASIASPPRSFPSWPPTMWRLDLLFFSILIYSISEHYIFFLEKNRSAASEATCSISFGILLKWFVQLILLHFLQGTCFQIWYIFHIWSGQYFALVNCSYIYWLDLVLLSLKKGLADGLACSALHTSGMVKHGLTILELIGLSTLNYLMKETIRLVKVVRHSWLLIAGLAILWNLF